MKHVGIIGGGGISDTHARAVREIPGVEIAGFYGDNYEKTAQLSKLYGGVVYKEFQSFLDHRPLDLVIIGSPSALHAEQGIAAARRGLHVLTEKPIDCHHGPDRCAHQRMRAGGSKQSTNRHKRVCR